MPSKCHISLLTLIKHLEKKLTKKAEKHPKETMFALQTIRALHRPRCGIHWDYFFQVSRIPPMEVKTWCERGLIWVHWVFFKTQQTFGKAFFFIGFSIGIKKYVCIKIGGLKVINKDVDLFFPALSIKPSDWLIGRQLSPFK